MLTARLPVNYLAAAADDKDFIPTERELVNTKLSRWIHLQSSLI